MFKRITSLLILLWFVIAPAIASPLMMYGIGPTTATVAWPPSSHAGSTPADIGSCIFWGSAHDLSAVGDGNAITTWTDKSGSGNNLTAVGSVIYNGTAGPDSRPALTLSGSTDKLTFASEKTNVRSIVAVIKINGYTSGNNPPALGAGHSSLYEWHSNAANNNYTDTGNTSASVYNGAWRHDGGSTFVPSNTEFTTTYKIVTAVATSTTTIDNFGSDRGSNYFVGNIVEWALFSTALSSANQDALNAYFGEKYNISVSSVI